jgi:transposase-like protein
VPKNRTKNAKENTMKIKPNRGVIIRYSEAFKLKVIEEIERGHLTITEAMRLYDIKGGPTIYNWIRKYGKNHLLKRIVRIEMKDEKDVRAEDKRRIRSLESALASTTLQLIFYQSFYEVAEEMGLLDPQKKRLLLERLSPEHQKMLKDLMSNARK